MANSLENIKEGTIFGLGNPLLDLLAEVDQDFLEKWSMKANDAILMEDKQRGLDEEMITKYQVKYVAGGAVQNTMRITEWLLNFKPNVCTYMGCIGKDKFGRVMEEEAIKDKINCVYLVDEEARTGYCCVLITDNGKKRSLCAYLGAANNMKKEHLMKNWNYVEKASLFYVSGFHLTVCVPAIMELAEYAAKLDNKTYCFNLSAPFICQFYTKDLVNVLPFVDILFGNETEAQTFADVQGWETKNLEEIASRIAKLEKKNTNKPRIVIITQGHDPVLVASTSFNEIKKYPVGKLEVDQIVDTNGAGDAFVAGFISQYIQAKDFERCIAVAIYAAQQVIQCDGAQYPAHPAEF